MSQRHLRRHQAVAFTRAVHMPQIVAAWKSRPWWKSSPGTGRLAFSTNPVKTDDVIEIAIEATLKYLSPLHACAERVREAFQLHHFQTRRNYGSRTEHRFTHCAP